MKTDFYFWCFVLWFSSIFLWGWMLTVRIKWVRVWIGGFSIILNFFLGFCMMPIFFDLCATHKNMDGIKTLYDFIVNAMYLFLVYAPMFVMGSLLRKNGKYFDGLKSISQNDLPKKPKKILRFLAFISVAVSVILFIWCWGNASAHYINKLMPVFVGSLVFSVPAVLWGVIVMMKEVEFRYKKSLNIGLMLFMLYPVVVGTIVDIFRREIDWDVRQFFYLTFAVSFWLFAILFVFLFALWLWRYNGVKNACCRCYTFFCIFFSKENYFKSSILVIGFIMMICLIAIALHFCLSGSD